MFIMNKVGWLIITGALLLNVVHYFENFAPTDRGVIHLITPAYGRAQDVWSQAELRCITRVVYNESRNQSDLGQLAVAATLLNRALSPKFPDHNVCDVAKQRGQYAYSTMPSPRNSIDRAALVKAHEIAEYAASNYGALPEDMRSFLYFNSHPPRKGSTTIGDHNFYV